MIVSFGCFISKVHIMGGLIDIGFGLSVGVALNVKKGYEKRIHRKLLHIKALGRVADQVVP